MEIPDNIFDAYDGKATLYVSKPEKGYKVNDLWILDETTQKSNDCPLKKDLKTKYSTGTLLVAITSSSSYNKTHWEEKTKYTDDTELNSFKESVY
jgi:hypothetical protein